MFAWLSSRRLLFARLIGLVLLGLALWPTPRMLSHISPHPTVFHYETGYAVVLATYLAAVLGWAVMVFWLFTPAFPDAWNRFCQRRPLSFLGMLLGLDLILVLVRSALGASLVVLPSSFGPVMVVIPMTFFAGIGCMAALLTGQESAAHLEQSLAGLMEWPGAWNIKESTRNTILVGLSLGLMAAFFLWLTVRPAYWRLPLFFDTSVHLYMGQHVLGGGIPYRTLIYFHPPARFLMSVIWNLGARLTGIPVLEFVRGLDLLIVVVTLIITFASGRLFTGRTGGGLLATAVLLGTELPLVLIYSDAPTFRLTTILIMMTGIWFGQREKWFACSVFLTFAALLWLPIVGQIVMVALAVLLSVKASRGRALVRLVGGMLVVIGITVLALGAWGVLRETYTETVRAVFLAVGDLDVTSDQTLFGALLDYATEFRESVWWLLRGDWEIVALSTIGLAGAILSNASRERRTPSQLVPLLTLVPMAFMMFFDNNGAPRDMAVFVMLWGPFAAWGLVNLIDQVRAGEKRLVRLQAMLTGMIFLAVVLVGVSDSPVERSFLESLPILDSSDQALMTGDLASALQGTDQVLSLGNLWYQVLADADNALPITNVRPRVPVNKLMGWDQQAIEQAIASHPPVVIMGWPYPDSFPGQMAGLYRYMGSLYVSHDQPAQTIFVIRDRPDIIALVKHWPLDP